MSLKNIRKQPEFIEGVGNIYPIEIKDYDDFQECVDILYISKKHFETNEENCKLLDMILFSCPRELIDIYIYKFEQLFNLTLRKKVKFKVIEGIGYSFRVHSDDDTEEGYEINNLNYENVRSVIMNQNIIHEQKVFKNKVVREWAELVIENKARNSPKISMEDMITTVSVHKKKNYEELDNYSIYQILSDFYRIRKNKTYDTGNLFNSVGADIKVDDFAEDLDLYHNPYDDLFVNGDKLSKFK